MYGMDIFSAEAGYVGKVHDIILDLEMGGVLKLTTQALRPMSKEEARVMARDMSVSYSNVLSVKDIVLVQRRGGPAYSPEPEEHAPEPQRAVRSRTSSTGLYKKSPAHLIRHHRR